MRATVALTRVCTTSSVSSSSSKITTSFTLRTPRLRSSPSAAISRITMGEREMALSTRICPRSMRLAISTSPSRVSSGTVPISRRYMRTGSLVFSSVPGVRSSSTSSPSSSSKSLSPGNLGAVEQIDALGADGGDQIVKIVGRADLVRQNVVDVAVGEIALLFADFDQACNLLRICFVNRQIIPLSPATCIRAMRAARVTFQSAPHSLGASAASATGAGSATASRDKYASKQMKRPRHNARWNEIRIRAHKKRLRIRTHKKKTSIVVKTRKRARTRPRFPLRRRTYFSRNRMTALQVSPGSPASRSSCVGQRGAHPH